MKKKIGLIAGLLALAWPTAVRAGDGVANAMAKARHAARSIQPALGSSLSLGRCALGPAQACFDRLLLGLPLEDRAYVRLSGRKIVVALAHSSISSNFLALQEVANSSAGRTVIEVLRPQESYAILGQTSWPNGKLAAMTVPMGSAKTKDGFEGYTFFPYRGKLEAGILYSTAPDTLVAVNTDQLGFDTITESIHHELRHVLLGGFGRTALKAAHGLPAVEKATRQAEDEAKRFEKTPLAS